ncbi:MAG: RNA polymerase sigma factor [Chloroflexota bacterium]|nr:RNA polymerase sigma factor [Chloroflexota bacterium]
MNSFTNASQTNSITLPNIASIPGRSAGNTATGKGPADRQATLAQIYDAYVEAIYKFVYYKVSNREDAEDITSQVFFKAANSLDVNQGEQARLAWLYQVARTTITDHWRRFYKGPTSSLDEMEKAAPLHLAAEPVATGTKEETIGQSTNKVLMIMGLLPENYRRVLQLRYLEGCSLKETATAMGISEGNAKVMQHRALQKAIKVGERVI